MYKSNIHVIVENSVRVEFSTIQLSRVRGASLRGYQHAAEGGGQTGGVSK
jgi:hypothetical protein